MGLDNYRLKVREKKRASILAAARANFLKGGFSQTSMIDIAKEADVSTATLYKHFTSKEALFLAVLGELRHMRDHKNLLATSTEGVEETLKCWAHNAITDMYENHVCALMRLVIAEVPSTPELAKAVFARIMEKREHLVVFLDEQVEKRNLRPHDTAMAAHVLHSVLKDYFVWPAMFDADFCPPPDMDEIIDRVVTDYMKLYAA